jgi:hypothetical protein
LRKIPVSSGGDVVSSVSQRKSVDSVFFIDTPTVGNNVVMTAPPTTNFRYVHTMDGWLLAV